MRLLSKCLGGHWKGVLVGVALTFLACQTGVAQGWVAEVFIQIDHEDYSHERIDFFRLTYSGVTVTGQSETGGLKMMVPGNTALSGDIRLFVNGSASAPYHPSDPPTEIIQTTLNANYSTPCITGIFERSDEAPNVHLYFRILIHPRMEISGFLQQCGQLDLTSNTCSASYDWEVSESISGGFKPLPGKTSRSIVITHDDLTAAGFSSPYGRKYFRVTGLENTTSLLQPIDIYYPGPSLLAATTPPKCPGASDGTLALDITSAFSSVIDDFVVTLLNGAGDPLRQYYLQDENRIVLDDLPAGSYSVVIENSTEVGTYGNCWTEKTFQLADPQPVIISAAEITNYNGFEVRCSGSHDGMIAITPTGGTGVYGAYEWSPNVSATPVAAGLSKGTYEVRVKDSNQCWSEAYSYTLAEPNPLTTGLYSIGGRNGFDVSCYDKADGKIQAEVTGGVYPYRYTWDSGDTTVFREQLTPGTYTLAISDNNGCTSRDTITLVAPEPIAFAIEELQPITCAGDHSGALGIHSIRNAIGVVNATWSSGETDFQINDKSSGIFDATVSDAQGCSTTVGYELKDPPTFAARLAVTSDYHGTAISCDGMEDGELTAILLDDHGDPVAGDDYAWYRNGVELNSPAGQATARGLGAALYKVEITYGAFCKTEDVLSLNEPEPLVAHITEVNRYNGVPISCAGSTDGHLRAFATGGTGDEYHFKWNTGATGPDLENIGAGTFLVTAVDLNGCAATKEEKVIGPDSLKTHLFVLSDYNGQPISCSGGSDARLEAVPKGGTGPYAFAWNAGQTGPLLMDVAAGSYSVTTRDANGCTHIADISVTDPAPVCATISGWSDYHGFGVSCYGASDGYLRASGAGGTGYFTYRWQASDNTNNLYTGLRPGEYQVIVSDGNHCSDTAAAIVTSPEPLTVSTATFRDVTCNGGDDGEILLRADGGAGGYVYVLGDTRQHDPAFNRLPAATYFARVSDANLCTAGIAQTIAEPPPIAIRFDSIASALCGDPKGKIFARINGGTGQHTLRWKNANGDEIGSEPNISGLTAGVYTLVVRDEHLCEVQSSAGVPSSDGPTAEVVAISPASCSYATDGSASLEAHGHDPFTFHWQDGSSSSSATSLSKGRHLVEVSDSKGCRTIVPVEITAPDSLVINVIKKILPSCAGDCNGAIGLEASGGTGLYHYDWGNASGPLIAGLCAGTYAVTVSDENQCTGATTVELSEPQPIEASWTELKTPVCPNDCDGRIEVQGSGGTGHLRYLWSTGETEPAISGLCAGEYNLMIADSNQCTVNLPFKVTDPAGPSLNLGESVLLCAGQTHLLDPGPAWKAYAWGSDQGTVSAERRLTISAPGTYWVEVIDYNGCTARDTFLLSTSDDLLKANFLLTTEAFALDTVVAIDITWPLPSSARWILPDEMLRLQDFDDVVYGQFPDPGSYAVTLSATLGACRDQLTKTVNILRKPGQSDSAGKLGQGSPTEKFTVFPNPNGGRFSVAISLAGESPIVLTLFDLFTSKILARTTDAGRRDYTIHFDLGSMSAGTYSLRLDYRGGKLYRRIIIR